MKEAARLFGDDRGREVHEFIESALGVVCPCWTGGRSLLLPGAPEPVDGQQVPLTVNTR